MSRALLALALLMLVPAMVFAQAPAEEPSADTDTPTKTKSSQLQYLVPEMEGQGFRVDPGKRQFKHRLAFSPAVGQLGDGNYYAFRVGYNPNEWLGYEASLGHNPDKSVHALLNSLNVVVRYPLPGRFQPYVSAGYGMMLVFPGAIFKADPVTKNVVGAGAGLEIYLRNDVALRSEIRNTTVLGGRTEADTSAAFSYREFTFGMTFYKTLNR